MRLLRPCTYRPGLHRAVHHNSTRKSSFLPEGVESSNQCLLHELVHLVEVEVTVVPSEYACFFIIRHNQRLNAASASPITELYNLNMKS